MKRNSSGFTIVELMVAMVILMIISAIAIPHYLSALQRGHEAVAVSYLRQVQTAEEAYRLANQGYADTFSKLQPYVSADLMVPDSPQLAEGGFVSVAYAEPLPPQGKSGSSPGKGGTTPPGQGGTPPGQSGGSSGSSGGSSGSSGSTSGGSSSGSASSGGSSGSSSSSTTPDSKVYSMYIFYLSSNGSTDWDCSAEPIRDRLSNRFYYTDESNTIHVSVGAVADSASPQL